MNGVLSREPPLNREPVNLIKLIVFFSARFNDEVRQ